MEKSKNAVIQIAIHHRQNPTGPTIYPKVWSYNMTYDLYYNSAKFTSISEG